MSKQFTQEEVSCHKKQALSSLDQLLRKYIYSGNEELLKKANLMNYWIQAFTKYIDEESTFNSKRLINYSRGNVIRLNFGFNVGREFGGLHYAVVIGKHNTQASEVLTVIPLSSTDGKNIHSNSVDLGSELYEKINAKQTILLNNLQRERVSLNQLSDALLSSIEFLSESMDETSVNAKMNELKNYTEEMLNRKTEVEHSLHIVKRNQTEINKLKRGSMAIVNQITTVSKQRIYTPKKSEDFLYDVSLSTSAMEKINAKLKELYVFP